MKTKLFGKIVKDPAFYKAVLMIGLPIAFQNMITLAVSVADTLMLGRADTTGLLLSASSLANQPFTLMTSLCFGLSGGTSVLCTQYYGKGDYDAIRTVFSIVLRCAVLLTFGFAFTVLTFPEWVMSLFTNKAETIAAGAEYLSIIGWAYVFFGISYTLQCMLRTVAKVNISVFTSVTSLLINIFGNWVLIFGNLGFKPMGIKGAAIATLIARLVEFAIMFVYTFFIESDIKYRLRHLFLRSSVLFRDFFRYGLPVFFNEASWSLAVAVQASIIGHITYSSGDPVAAYAINDIMSSLSILGIWGIAGGSAVLVGSAIGEGDLEKAKERANTFQLLGVLCGLIGTALILIIKNPLLSIYNMEPETHKIAVEMLNVTASVQVFVALSAVAIVGALRCAADTVFCFVSESISLWCVSIPLAFVGANVLHVPVWGIILLMRTSEIIKATVCHIRVRRGRFIKDVTREKSEIA